MIVDDPYVTFVLVMVIMAVFTVGYTFGLSEGRRERPKLDLCGGAGKCPPGYLACICRAQRETEFDVNWRPPPNVITFIRGNFVK